MKKRIVIAILSVAAAATVLMISLTSCGDSNKKNTSTPDEAVPTTITAVSEGADYTVAETIPTLSNTEQAIVDEGLKVDDKGNITDNNGNKVEVKEDGTVEVKTQNGETVRVKADDVKTANVNNQKVEEATQKVNNSSNDSSSAKSNSSNGSSSKPNSDSKNNNSSSSTQTSNKPANNSGTQNNKKPNNNNSQNSATADPHAGKTYHEAVYKTVNHPAETKVVNHPAVTEKVKVVDKEAYTYEEPIYETQGRCICKGCGADITDNTTAHNKQHALNGEPGGYVVKRLKVQVDTKTVTVPEEYHYETKVVKEAWTETVVVKEAWTEKVLVKEAGWY